MLQAGTFAAGEAALAEVVAGSEVVGAIVDVGTTVAAGAVVGARLATVLALVAGTEGLEVVATALVVAGTAVGTDTVGVGLSPQAVISKVRAKIKLKRLLFSFLALSTSGDIVNSPWF